MNNFDTSSQGVKLELNCNFDIAMAENYFNESFERFEGLDGASLLNDRYSKVDIFIFTGGSISGDFDLTDLKNYDLKSETNKNLLNKILCSFYGDKEELKNDSLDLFSKYPYQLTKLELLELVENEFSENYQQFLNDNFKTKFEVLSIRGYSQGDYAEIIFTDELLKEYNFENKENFLSMMSNHFTNLFYDQPLYCKLELDDQEYYFDDFQNDQYIYDKEEIIKHAKCIIDHPKKEYVIKWLSENLPVTPDTY